MKSLLWDSSKFVSLNIDKSKRQFEKKLREHRYIVNLEKKLRERRYIVNFEKKLRERRYIVNLEKKLREHRYIVNLEKKLREHFNADLNATPWHFVWTS